MGITVFCATVESSCRSRRRSQQLYPQTMDMHVTDIKSIMLNNKDAKLASRSMYEEISFTYAKIEWTWMDGGITAMDDIGMGAGVKCFFFTAISNKCVILLIAISITQLIFEYFLTFFNKY